LDPQKKGDILWQTRIASPGPTVGTSVGVQWGMASDGRRVYAGTSAYGRTRPTDPSDTRRNIVDPRLGGGLTALRIADGSKAWYAPPIVCAPGAPPVCAPPQRRPSQAYLEWCSPVRWTAISAATLRRTARSSGTSIPRASSPQ